MPEAPGPPAGDQAIRVRLEHVAVWTPDVDRLVAFYTRWLAAQAGPPYRNPRTGLHTVFLTWPDCPTRLEVMARPDVSLPSAGPRLGYAHLALTVGPPEEVDRMTRELAAAEVRIAGQPRWTGDGYYEAVLLDPDGNPVELVAG